MNQQTCAGAEEL